MNNIPLNNPKLATQAILEVGKIADEFSCRDAEDMRQKMFAIMMDSWLNTEVFESSLQTLERSLGMPPDEMLPDLLSIYPMCPEHTRKIIDAFLSRAGLVDPTGALQHEVISWAKHRGRSTSRAVLRRRVNHFLARWRESWECNARMVAEELRQERLQAQVRADMLRAQLWRVTRPRFSISTVKTSPSSLPTIPANS